MINSFQKIDIKILEVINRYLRCKFLDKLMPVITGIGDGGILWILISIYLIHNSNYRIEGYMVLYSLILTTIVGEGIIKHLIRRARPFKIMNGRGLIISKPITYSFPSGHSASSFSVAGTFIILNSSISVYVTILAVLIAFSRLYLEVHYPTDVLTGIILGLLCSIVVYKMFNEYTSLSYQAFFGG